MGKIVKRREITADSSIQNIDGVSLVAFRKSSQEKNLVVAAEAHMSTVNRSMTVLMNMREAARSTDIDIGTPGLKRVPNVCETSASSDAQTVTCHSHERAA
jgi:hypothetical protein